MLQVLANLAELRKSKGLTLASSLEPMLHGLGAYGSVNVRKVSIPINVPVEDEALAQFARQWGISMNRFIAVPVNKHSAWLGPELQQAWKDEFDTVPWTAILPTFFVWVQKQEWSHARTEHM